MYRQKDPVPDDLAAQHCAAIENLASQIAKPRSKVPERVGMPTPSRIDDCFWRNRMLCEEMAFTMQLIAKTLADTTACEDLAACQAKLLASERAVFDVQESNTHTASKQIKQFLPQDFRGSLLEMKRAHTERTYQKAIDDLVKRGGTIRDKYDMHMKHQWERREALAQMGELSGMFKFLVKYMAGIPQVLLDFAKQINAKLGPMEEQRLKYGPDLYKVTTLGIKINVLVALWLENCAALSTEASSIVSVVRPAVDFYCCHLVRVIGFLGSIFAKSPFFVSAEAVAGSISNPESLPAMSIQGSSPTNGLSPNGSMAAYSPRQSDDGDPQRRTGLSNFKLEPAMGASTGSISSAIRFDGSAELAISTGASIGVLGSQLHRRILSDVPEDVERQGSPLAAGPIHVNLASSTALTGSLIQQRSSRSSNQRTSSLNRVSLHSVISEGYMSCEENQPWWADDHSQIGGEPSWLSDDRHQSLQHRRSSATSGTLSSSQIAVTATSPVVNGLPEGMPHVKVAPSKVQQHTQQQQQQQQRTCFFCCGCLGPGDRQQ